MMVQPMEDYNFLNNRNQAIENYIQRVTELTQLKQTIPTNEELLKIASELGISDGEIAIAQKQSQAHFLRAQGYYSLNHWEDAIAELEEALAFNPSHLPMLHLLINAYIGRWKDKHNRQDEIQARLRIKQCLEIQPDDQESLKLLAKLDQSIRNYQYRFWSLGAITVLFCGSIIGFFISDNLSLNLFNKNDQILQNLQQELNLEIDTLRKEQTLLYNESLEQLRNQQRINNDLENRIIELQNQIKNLEQKNQELLNKINQNQSSENPFNQIPESEINE
ncbi:tetratricopeptide repeat protein [Cyanobacterium aponinum AL20118]|uniref:Tetratricopeptide repeat-containing protein n=2 Tax=Cyanobacterium aponinum TaxID=379064 RepID=K9Z2N6_CYAAP|nr:tetratricopeptide repeat protein [Cyanobacterium aponinum]AFZ53414.1 Tetratricopeptide repeat-containing protein [Cyanobacterium aponinum PCC 10605]PHV61784.1 tetratricopeptide repeat protein [Cyanobacterium aponinum IPPAS B-1201]WPF89901.1 tetratricopeptide repeat protein [Cyanobacterium aponinum AL20115]